jgi:predicted O-linked N-acetylglucosamine transferase (SPINDLY family)
MADYPRAIPLLESAALHFSADSSLTAMLAEARRQAVKPGSAQAEFDLGNASCETGNYDEAIASYQHALALKPDFTEAHNNLGSVLSDLKRHEEAIASYRSALALRPAFAEAHSNLASVLNELKRHEEAIASCQQALAHKPDFAEAHCNLAGALNDLKRHEEAIASCRKALDIQPDLAEAHSNLGLALAALERHEEAVASCQRALAIKPDLVEAHLNLGNALNALKRSEEAIASYQSALALKPDFAEAHGNLGAALSYAGRYAEAIASCNKALALKPGFADAYNNLGTTLNALNRNAEAIASYQSALEAKPDFAEAHFSQGLALLTIGDFKRGWEQYEWRWATKGYAPTRDFVQPLWRGAEDLSGKTILLHSEQGFGDTLQFARYAPLLAARGARVVFEVQPALKALLTGLAGVEVTVAQGDALPVFDCHCPLLSMPLAFATTLQSIPAATPYLHANAGSVAKWQTLLGERSGPRVGLVWSGNPNHKNDRNRSIALARLLPLLAVPGVRFVSLQKDLRAEDAEALRNLSGLARIGDHLDDFADTAAAVSLLDLVITVDSAVAHLAGALGKPVWVLLPFSPDWRWLLEREDSPWYPSARLFRQPQLGDWESVIGRVREELLRFAPGPAARSATQTPPTQGTRTLTVAQALKEAFNVSQQGDPAEAGRPSRLLLQTGGDSFEALHLLSVLGARQGRVDEAIEIIIETLRRNPGSTEAHVLLIACAWSQLPPIVETLRERVTKGKSGEISPLGLLPLPESSASEQYLCARQYAEQQYGEFLSRPPLCGTELRATRNRLRIGYLSADYHEHPVSYLVAEVIERHDRSRFDMFGYSYGPDSDGPMRGRMRAAFDTFREIRPLSHEAAAQQILDDRIDILVDLTGYTTDTRLEILALRPAPVQVSWLGYAGTLGHPRLADYLIGDSVVSPIAHAGHYGETLALMPNCYQPNDRQRAVGAAPQRVAAGLPAHGFVFCCFNQSYKITAQTFDLWCRLLAKVPGSVLWLAQPTAAAERNLRREAQARGVAVERLIFAPRTPTLAEHYARLQCADLALDTYPYTSHTTASDALWAGVPLVTLRGETFASRVAASILHAAQLPELVTDSKQQCYRLALELATDPGRLAQIRARLAANRLSCALFDSERFTRDLERLFRQMWTDYCAGTKQPIVLGAHEVGRDAERNCID